MVERVIVTHLIKVQILVSEPTNLIYKLNRKEKMQLNISERVVLLEVLPQESNFLTAKAIQNLAELLSLTLEEQKLYLEQKTQGDQTMIMVKPEGSKAVKEINVDPLADAEITKILKQKNDENKLKVQEISIYEKFVEAKLKGEQNEK
jgi:hypothetical protein